MAEIKSLLKIDSLISDIFITTNDFRQGDGLSCESINICLKEFICKTNVDTSSMISRKPLQILVYADNLDLTAVEHYAEETDDLKMLICSKNLRTIYG